ncbi:ankyrin repeat-containing domain protein [Xylaria digitata]|nr:ankyrin repeat-containing domain protein [Xylaria digitata]
MIKAVTPPSEIGFGYKTGPPNDFEPNEKIFNMLLETGIKLDEISVKNKDLLHHAIHRSCNLKTVELLLSCGAHVHSRPDPTNGKTMLHSAAASWSADSQQIVELLLRNGASCTKEYGGHTILESVLRRRRAHFDESERTRRFKLCSFLLNNGAKVNGPKKRRKKLSWTPFLTRLLENDAPDALIYRTIQAGEDLNPLVYDIMCPYTPLQLAVHKGRFDVARRLIDDGADINAPAKLEDGRTALQAACNPLEGCKIHLGLVQFPLNNGADVNAPAARWGGITALQGAIMNGSLSAFSLLLDAGANFHDEAVSSGNRYHSALDIAALHGRLDMVDMLLKKGAQSFNQGKTPYEGTIKAAICFKHFSTAKMMEDFAKLNQQKMSEGWSEEGPQEGSEELRRVGRIARGRV